MATETPVFGGQVGNLTDLATEKGVFGGQVTVLRGLATEMLGFGGQVGAEEGLAVLHGHFAGGAVEAETEAAAVVHQIEGVRSPGQARG